MLFFYLKENITFLLYNLNVINFGLMKSTVLISSIEKDGWYLVRTIGSHPHFKHPSKKRCCYYSASKKRYSKRHCKFNF